MTDTRLFKSLDLPTFEFLIRLRAANGFWFMALVACAKQNPMTALSCINEAVRLLPKSSYLNPTGVNAFQICKAVNQGQLNNNSFSDLISNDSWHLYRYRIVNDFNLDKNALLQLTHKSS